MWRNTAAVITWADHRWIDRSMNPKLMSVMIAVSEQYATDALSIEQAPAAAAGE
jgi:hypothetical protein